MMRGAARTVGPSANQQFYELRDICDEGGEIDPVTGAAQQHKKRLVPLRKTTAMFNAERQNAKILEEIWHNGEAVRISSAEESAGPATPVSGSRQMSMSSVIADNNTFLRLNIGGCGYIILTEALLLYEKDGGFLSKFVQLPHTARLRVADAYLSNTEEYYFQRSPVIFDAIFQFYATGVIHRPPEICPAAFLAEMDFWNIPTSYVGSCCADVIPKAKEEVQGEELVCDKTFDTLMFGNLRRKMWTFLESPGSSTAAKIFELSSTLFVFISVMGLSLGTIPDFQIILYMPPINETVLLPDGSIGVIEKVQQLKVEHPVFVFVERICIAFFTVEYSMRIFAAPRKSKFAFKPLNMVDLLAIVPFYIELVLTLCGVDDKKLRDLRWAFLVVRILRVLRVIRIIKLGRFSSGLQTFGMTLQRSQKQLQMMMIVLLTGVIFFSTMIYFLEKDEPDTPFTSIPAAYWWCIVTMTTVGYGDVVPTSTAGKIVASAAIMCGVLVLALPITIIVDNFIKVAQDEQAAEQQKQDEQHRAGSLLHDHEAT